MKRFIKEELEFAKFPNLAQNWTISQDAFNSKVDWEKLNQKCEETGLSANIEAYIGKEDNCTHQLRTIRKETISENLAIAEVQCVDCGKLLAILAKRILKRLEFNVEDQNGGET